MPKYVRRFMHESTEVLIRKMTHEDLDRMVKELLEVRPYKFGDKKETKIKILKEELGKKYKGDLT